MKIILTHHNSDFDAIASLLGAHKLYPEHVPVLSKKQNRNVREFLALYQNGLPFVQEDDLSEATEVLLVDTQKVPDFKGLRKDLPLSIIDHHPRMDDTPEGENITVEVIGANATLMVERLQEANVTLDSLEATLLALGIYEDTGSLTFGNTTPRDIRAAAWLLEQQAVLDTVRRFLTPPLTPEQQKIYDQLLQQIETRNIQGYNVVIATTTLEDYIPELASIAHRLGETLEPAALFLVVQMPDYVQLICRSAEDAIDAGEIARLFEGGGHPRAAASAITGGVAEKIIARIWEALQENVRPSITIGDLMSVGVQTVKPDDKVGEIISRLRRMGHEGYPVTENNRVIGLLTLRDSDRAMEHGLKNAPVREIMTGGEIFLKPLDSVAKLEQTIVESGWGQIPVVQDGHLIGIVTRTDLIKHWAKLHPAPKTSSAEGVSLDLVREVLGAPVAALIANLSQYAQEAQTSLYMVGGVVRDLLLKRPNFDIDFVVETDAIVFAKGIQREYGGEVSTHPAFGTAKWRFDERVAQKLNVSPDELPHHVDFATARNEFYEHPTALPTVYAGSIKLDLQRRDFTINTLAVQLSPTMGRILDFYNGLADLRNGVIRVLHSLSFVDDPTRVLRAVRFSHRLGFPIEGRTEELIGTAREMLKRITGERVRNELTLLLKEHEPERGLAMLEGYEALRAIHPALVFTYVNMSDFQTVREKLSMEMCENLSRHEITDVYWALWLARIPPPDAAAVCERLLMGKTETDTVISASELVHEVGILKDTGAKGSMVVARLDGVPEIALLAAWVIGDETMRGYLQRYVSEWQHIRPTTNGNTLKSLGLPPGPAYKRILDQLRAARIDGEVTTDEGETELLNQLIEEIN
jgi:tRNA nucleotidyltransferase (CCA-adding enzyme)